MLLITPFFFKSRDLLPTNNVSLIDRTEPIDKSLFRLGLDWLKYALKMKLQFEPVFWFQPLVSTANVDDLRESPAVEVVHLLKKEGALVKAWEPFKPEAGLKGIDMSPNLEEALKDADAILLLAKHTEFVELDPSELTSRTAAKIVIDMSTPGKPKNGRRQASNSTVSVTTSCQS